jgi:hypothetical protein
VPENAPAVTEAITWHESGRLQRTRDLLGEQIVTTLAGNSWRESLGSETRSLDARTAAMLRREMQRHPLMLLAAYARGQLQFRPVAQRGVGDREFMVLEAVGDRFRRLRVQIDIESHLVRVVEAWETLPDDTIVHVRETWSDYRQADTLRAPHLRQTSRDDGRSRSETVYEDWRPQFEPR